MSESKTDETQASAEVEENDNVADEEDLEKLQAEIAKMEEEAARIAAETASLEQKDGEASAGADGENKEKDAPGKASANGAFRSWRGPV